MEDAIALATALGDHPDDVPVALAAYESAARPPVDRIQGSARPSLSWWEHFGRYHDTLEPWQFAFHFLSRSIGAEKLARRDPGFVAGARQAWTDAHGAGMLASPLTIGICTFPGRRVALDQVAESGLRLLQVSAPAEESGLADARAALLDGLADKPDLVVVRGGSPLCRSLLSEESRLGHGVPTLLVQPDATDDVVETLVLAGRADLVAEEGTR
jgi:anthraniloyl-CoA monooxygenase